MSFLLRTVPVGPVMANCHLILFPAEAVLIDPGGDPEHLLSVIGERNLRTVLITHGHYDHIGALGVLKERFPDAAVMIHAAEKEFLRDPSLNLSGWFGSGFSYATVPERLLDDGDEIAMPEANSLRVIHTPGHTPGGACFLWNGMLFSGDTLFFEGIGRCDLPGGDEATLLASIREKLFTLPDDTRVLPGHMNETTIAHERRHNPFVADRSFFFPATG